jgi:hypothetical protein
MGRPPDGWLESGRALAPSFRTIDVGGDVDETSAGSVKDALAIYSFMSARTRFPVLFVFFLLFLSSGGTRGSSQRASSDFALAVAIQASQGRARREERCYLLHRVPHGQRALRAHRHG